MRAPLAPPRMSEPRNVEADAQAVETNWEMDSPEPRILSFESSDILLVNQLMVNGGYGILPQLGFRNPGSQATRDGSHVAMNQLVPGLGEGCFEFLRVLMETFRDLLVDRVHDQRQVGREHHRRVRLRPIVRVRYEPLGRFIRRSPLPGAAGLFTNFHL